MTVASPPIKSVLVAHIRNAYVQLMSFVSGVAGYLRRCAHVRKNKKCGIGRVSWRVITVILWNPGDF